jgi:hypothetical protein
MRDSLNFSSLSNRIVHSKSSLTVNKVCGKDGVDQCGLSETCLSYTKNSCQITTYQKVGRGRKKVPTQMMLN